MENRIKTSHETRVGTELAVGDDRGDASTMRIFTQRNSLSRREM